MDLFDQLRTSGLPGKANKKHNSPSQSEESDHSPKYQKSPKTQNDKNNEKNEKNNNEEKEKKQYERNEKKSYEKSEKKSNEKKLAKFNEKHKSNNSSSRRESMPPPVSHLVVKKSKSNKSRSLSPPITDGSQVIKSLKVKVERKRLEEFLKRPLPAHANSIKAKHDKLKDIKAAPRQKTPTKAQQKLFEPDRSNKSKSPILREFNIKRCAVRIRRDDLQKLQRDFKKNKTNNKSQSKSPLMKPAGKSSKRPASSSGIEDSPPAKKGKIPPLKIKTNFFIKISSPKLEKKSKPLVKVPSSSSVALHNKIKNSKSLGTTAPTKFSRSQLIRSFGKRFFTSYVRIEKCAHPLLLTFESNDRARRLKSKRNKSKNLSVSFREQVEILGGISDSDDSHDENFCVVPPPTSRNGRRSNIANIPVAAVPATPLVMPARLKKVENGKVVDDIELDPSLFLDPKNLVASTPYSPGRKKRDHKSFSPLKDEGTPSPRKEQLKLANERIPPSGLRRLNIDEEDDEDDDCEYIVPIELPQRRTSRASSTNTIDGGPVVFPPTSNDVSGTEEETDAGAITKSPAKEMTRNILNQSPVMTDSPIPIANLSPSPIASDSPLLIPVTSDTPEPEATQVRDTTVTKNTAGNERNNSDDTESRESFHSAKQSIDKRPSSLSPTSVFNDVFDRVAAAAPGAPSERQNVPELNGSAGNCKDAIVDDASVSDMPMNLFIEDDSQEDGDSPGKSFVDSIINETIDKLGKDIDEGNSVDEQYTNRT